ncbi:MAG: hypothetical protein IIB73_08395 [Proteobacteria bacterium]|nr:hypothetical protein [Pseudomonadota bacterium]
MISTTEYSFNHDDVKAAVEDESELSTCVLKGCDKNKDPDTNFYLAKYYFRTKKLKKQRTSLERAIAMGRYKYDPMVLLNYAKVAAKTKAYGKVFLRSLPKMQLTHSLSDVETFINAHEMA